MNLVGLFVQWWVRLFFTPMRPPALPVVSEPETPCRTCTSPKTDCQFLPPESRYEKQGCCILDQRKVKYISQRGNVRTGEVKLIRGSRVVISRKKGKPFVRTLVGSSILNGSI